MSLLLVSSKSVLNSLQKTRFQVLENGARKVARKRLKDPAGNADEDPDAMAENGEVLSRP